MTASLGQKHQCSHCSTRFYDLHKDPAVCPKCGTIAQVQASLAQTPKHNSNKHDEYAEDALMRMSISTDGFDDDFDAMVEPMDDDDDEIESLSELDEREKTGLHAGHDDDVEEDKLMDELDNDVILDGTHDEDEMRV